jgi:hypothetical protein
MIDDLSQHHRFPQQKAANHTSRDNDHAHHHRRNASRPVAEEFRDPAHINDHEIEEDKDDYVKSSGRW